MVNTRNNVTEGQIDPNIQHWVTNHIDTVVAGITEQLTTMSGTIQQLVTSNQYFTTRLAHGEGNNRYSRLGKMEFPKFYGDDVKGWLYRVKQFFTIDNVDEVEKVKIVSIHMYERALTWHLQFMRTHGENVTWQNYEEAVLLRFGDVNEDPMAELKNLRYKSTMRQYQSDFEALLTQVNITEAQAISMFIAGLPASIEVNVRMFKPRTLADAFSLSSLQETALVLTRQRYTPILPTPKPITSTSYANRNVTYPAKSTSTLALPAPPTHNGTKNSGEEGIRPRRQLSQVELNDKRAKGLCFYCDKKYMPGHKCEGQMFTLEIKGVEEGELDGCLEEADNETDITRYVLE